ncbi:MAG TPA: RNA-binding protein [Candidatus Marinimicrobia bacterium]|jgi:RNA recognition motif-containing protein|nr:RNA-binding protein [Candidatus Neomarinimicrobiota bacterium]HIO49708.1 RNA-binding protein [Candidatus Poribacteria bacterium]HIB03689.1 RNA-binding protein [Candidatus Neomarinimicrobiota bacterium]HIB71635.1 RNA-binding protein [Candidatus Neomarinimicrobiota bacterium]HIB96149.1 RNA-binding protein [Candidatus Neomarinimicrobiota bacterium]
MNLYVGNLSYEMSEEDLRNEFAEYGEVQSAKIITDKFTGRSRGFGFVEMASDESGKKAMEELNEKDVSGRQLVVNEARPRR